jgi:hypothetical protein
MSIEHSPARQRRSGARSIAEWCQDYGISEALFFKMRSRGETPDQIKLGARTLISDEADARWRRNQERRARKLKTQAT